MTGSLAALANPATYEELVDGIVAVLRRKGAVSSSRPTPWDAFLALSHAVHEGFEIPATTVTPVLRRLLFALGFAARPRNLVGVGTYVGYAFAWLLRDRGDARAGPFCESARGIDVDRDANRLARRNCARLGHGSRLTFVDGDGTLDRIYERPVDLLYLDLDDADRRKAGYVLALRAASARLRPGALVLAHDPCVPMFAGDFAVYHEFVRESPRFDGPWVLPVDECGLSVAAAR
jgi:predicted O-methyltransferase YrrM